MAANRHGAPSSWAIFRQLLAKDLRVEWQGRETIAPLATVSVLVALIANVAFDAVAAPPTILVAATVWVALIFAAQVGLARTFVVEHEQGTLAGLQASPIDMRTVFLSKVTANLATVTLTGILTGAIAIAFFDLGRTPTPATMISIAAALLLACAGITILTTLAAAIAMHGRHWVLLVPLLALPALFPLVAVGVPATAALLGGATLASQDAAIRVLVAYVVAVGAASWVLAPTLLEP